MSSWGEGYVTDLGYTHGFYRHLAPSHLNYTALAKGILPPRIDQAFTYCELGCGQGFGLCLLAAANSQGQFWGVDFNPSHIAFAQRLTTAASLSNLHWFDDSFTEFDQRQDLPQFDYICLHGIYSWISPENRQILIQFIRRQLKVGGLVSISYNCLPGWSPIQPLRDLMIRYGDQVGGSTEQRLEETLAWVGRLAKDEIEFFQINPLARQKVDQFDTYGRPYLAQEYFNRHWTPFYFDQVAGDLSQAKLSYIGSSDLSEHFDDYYLNPQGLALLEETSDPYFREVLRDYLLNQKFRRDLFSKGGLPLTVTELAPQLQAQRFALIAPRPGIDLDPVFPRGTVHLDPERYDPVLEVLATAPSTLADLLADPNTRDLGFPRLHRILLMLVKLKAVAPSLAASDPSAPSDLSHQNEQDLSTRRLNQVILATAEHHPLLEYLASPVTGSALCVPQLGQLFLAASLQDLEPIPYAQTCLARQGHPVPGLSPQEEPEQALAEHLALFQRDWMPVLAGLGIIQGHL